MRFRSMFTGAGSKCVKVRKIRRAVMRRDPLQSPNYWIISVYGYSRIDISEPEVTKKSLQARAMHDHECIPTILRIDMRKNER